MKYSKKNKLVTRLLHKVNVQALLLASIVVIPLALYTLPFHRTLTPLNVLSECCGWDYARDRWQPYNLQISDTVDFILPMNIYTYESFKSGIFPFWNPYFFGGGEFFSNSQSAVLHPMNFLYLFFGPLAAHTISVLLSIYVMIVGSYLLLRKVNLRPWPSAIGALGFVSVPWVIFWLEWGTIGWIMALWPVILYFLYRFRDSSYCSGKDIVIATALVGIQFYFGHMQFAMFTLGIVIVWWIVSLALDIGRRVRIATVGSLMIITSILLGALTLVNTINMSLAGHRTGKQIVSWDAIIKSDIAPQLSSINLKVDPQFYVPTTSQIEVVRILFIVGICLAVWAIYRKKVKIQTVRHSVLFLALIWILGIGFAFSLPGFRHILDILPIGKGILQHYFIALSVMAAPFIAGHVFDTILSSINIKQVRIKKYLGKNFKYIAYLMCLISIVGTLLGVIYFVITKNEVLGLGWLVLLPILAGILLLLLERNSTYRQLIVPISTSIGIMVIQYWGLIYAYLPMPSNNLYNVGNNSYACIKNDAATAGIVHPRALSVLSSNSHMIYGISVLSGYDSLYPKSKKVFHDALNYPLKQREVYGENALLDVNYNKEPVNRALGINYMVLYKSTPRPEGYYPICSDPTGRYQVYKAEEKAEVIYFADMTEKLSSDQQVEQIKNNRIDNKTILTDKLPTRKYATGMVVDGYSIKANTITVSTNQPEEGLLFIGETFNDGWKAKVNGNSVSIYKADYDFMAIELPPGKNSIELTFTPKYFTASLLLTVIGFIGLGTLAYLLYSTRLRLPE